jgi:hypothetical protein
MSCKSPRAPGAGGGIMGEPCHQAPARGAPGTPPKRRITMRDGVLYEFTPLPPTDAPTNAPTYALRSVAAFHRVASVMPFPDWTDGRTDEPGD